MPTKQQLPPVRNLESIEDFSETRLEAIGFIFHGTVKDANGKPHSVPLAIQSAPFRPLRQTGEGGRERNENLVSFACEWLSPILNRAHRAPSIGSGARSASARSLSEFSTRARLAMASGLRPATCDRPCYQVWGAQPRTSRSNNGFPRRWSKSDSSATSDRSSGSRASAAESSSRAFTSFSARLQ